MCSPSYRRFGAYRPAEAYTSGFRACRGFAICQPHVDATVFRHFMAVFRQSIPDFLLAVCHDIRVARSTRVRSHTYIEDSIRIGMNCHVAFASVNFLPKTNRPKVFAWFMRFAMTTLFIV